MRLWHLLSCFQVSQLIFEKLFLTQESTTATQWSRTLAFTESVAPTKCRWRGQHSQLWLEHTISSFLLHAFLHLFMFLCPEESTQPSKFLRIKILSLQGSPQIPASLLLKAVTIHFLAHIALNIFSLNCNYFNYLYYFPT